MHSYFNFLMFYLIFPSCSAYPRPDYFHPALFPFFVVLPQIYNVCMCIHKVCMRKKYKIRLCNTFHYLKPPSISLSFSLSLALSLSVSVSLTVCVHVCMIDREFALQGLTTYPWLALSSFVIQEQSLHSQKPTHLCLPKCSD